MVSCNPRVFEPFFTTKPAGKGTGLGLAMVYGIVKQSGGYVQIQSDVGRGTAVHVFIPSAPSPERDVEHSGNEHDGTTRFPRTILVVEDNPAIRRTMGLFLRQGGATTMVASNGEDALRISESCGQSIDLLITDVIMPGMNGPDVSDLITARHPNIRVLYMSGHGDATALRDRMTLGVNFIQKPFTNADLWAKINHVMAGDPPPLPSAQSLT